MKIQYIITCCLVIFCSCSTTDYDYSASMEGDSIVISTNNPEKSDITIERKFSPTGIGYVFNDGNMSAFSIKDSVTLQVANKESINTSDILNKSHNKMSIAYEYAKLNKIAWRVHNNFLDTVVYTTPFLTKQDVGLYADIKSGTAAKLYTKSQNDTKDIKSYLYDQGVQFSDSLIINMNSILNQLDNSEYVIYTTEDDIPIIKSFAGIRYNLSTNIKADYYYLLATDSEEELNEFIKEVSLNDFEMGETNMRNSVSCFRANEKGGYLTIFFIGLNKDWSKHIVPIGMVAIDNIKPSVLSDNSSVEAFLSSNSKNAQFEDLILYSKGIRIAMPNKYPKISGQIYISTNSFRGNHANFEFGLFENGDIESISIKREVHRDYMKRVMKPETKTIKLSDKKSPYHFTYELDLGIGDNYIPITVTDKRGNKTNYTYKISMVQVEDNDPDINIDNNINIY